MDNTFFIADTHFNHANIISYCDRPYANLAEMHRDLISRWNSVVSKNDTVYMLGDFAFGAIPTVTDLAEKLNGRKVLILGNHDKHKPHQYLSCGFDSVSANPIIIHDKYILSHRPLLQPNIPSNFVNIFGHIHNNTISPFIKNSFCVSVEKIDYTPITLDEINFRMRNKIIA